METVTLLQHTQTISNRGRSRLCLLELETGQLTQQLTLCRGIALLGKTTDITQYRTCFDRCQLIPIAKQNQFGMRRQGIEQACHHRQVDHRGFINHQHIQVQRVVPVMAEGNPVRDSTQQAVNSARLGRNIAFHYIVNSKRVYRRANRFGQPGCRLTGRRNQLDVRQLKRALLIPLITLNSLGHQRRQQFRHCSCLAGTRAARNHRKLAGKGNSGCNFLPVQATARRHQTIQHR